MLHDKSNTTLLQCIGCYKNIFLHNSKQKINKQIKIKLKRDFEKTSKVLKERIANFNEFCYKKLNLCCQLILLFNHSWKVSLILNIQGI